MLKRYLRFLLTFVVFLLLSWITLPKFLWDHAVDGGTSGRQGGFRGLKFLGNHWHPFSQSADPNVVDLPPLYPNYFEYEASLPQNIAQIPQLEPSPTTKYIYFANHVHLLGFNNHLQELVLNAHLAYLTNRSFAFYEYVWSPAWREGKFWVVWPEGNGDVEVVSGSWRRKGGDWEEGRARGKIVNGKGKGTIIPSRVPLSAFVGGWVGGGARVNTSKAIGDGHPPNGDDLTPVSRPHFDHICPEKERFYISANEVNDAQLSQFVLLDDHDSRKEKKVRESTGEEITRAWIARLSKDDVRDQKCVEIVRNTGQVFDFWVFGTPSLHPLWPSLRHSPILKYWSWSPLVCGAFTRNALGLGIEWPKTRDSAQLEGRGVFGERVKELMENEVVNGAAPMTDLALLGYPPYPHGYPYPPLVNDPEALKIGSTNPGNDGILTGQPLEVLPYPKSPSTQSPSLSTTTKRRTTPMLALHLRRGDFEQHCDHLAKFTAAFTAFSSLAADQVPFIGNGRSAQQKGDAKGADAFVVPRVGENEGSVGGSGQGDVDEDEERRAVVSIRISIDGAKTANVTSHVEYGAWLNHDGITSRPHSGHTEYVVSTEDERRALYMKSCFPTTDQIGKRVRDVVREWAVARFVEFVEEFEKGVCVRQYHDPADADGDGSKEGIEDYRMAFMKFRQELEESLTSVYLMTNGHEAWAGEVAEEVGAVLKTLVVRAKVDVEIDSPSGEAQRSILRRAFEWSNPDWGKLAVEGRPDGMEDQGTEGEGGPDEGVQGEGESTKTDDGSQSSTAVLTISSSRDLLLTPEEKYVSQAVDMYIGQRAELFIGNGFSSLTSNIVMLRLQDSLEGVRTRFW